MARAPGVDAAHVAALLGGESRDEMIDELGNVVGALAERRHHDREYIQSVVEILAKLAALHHVDHVAVGGGDQADVHLDRATRADGIDLALLDGAEELDLHVERQFGDFVEEEGAAVGLLELAESACRWRR